MYPMTLWLTAPSRHTDRSRQEHHHADSRQNADAAPCQPATTLPRAGPAASRGRGHDLSNGPSPPPMCHSLDSEWYRLRLAVRKSPVPGLTTACGSMTGWSLDPVNLLAVRSSNRRVADERDTGRFDGSFSR
jgi:hypothetical protein